MPPGQKLLEDTFRLTVGSVDHGSVVATTGESGRNGGAKPMRTGSTLISALLLVAHAAALEVARPFGDGMVLPCGRAFPVWGTATPGAEVRVGFAGRNHVTMCAPDGKWRVTLPPDSPALV